MSVTVRAVSITHVDHQVISLSSTALFLLVEAVCAVGKGLRPVSMMTHAHASSLPIRPV
jgi:hypothetical protein